MSVGYVVDKAAVDRRAGFVAQSIRDALAEATKFKSWLDQRTVADLVALGYSNSEATLLKAAFFELDALSQVAHGAAPPAGPSDFFYNARLLIGVN
jgi:hypothetical protein